MQEDSLCEGRQGRREIPNLFHIPLDTVREVSSFLRKTSGAFPTLESSLSQGAVVQANCWSKFPRHTPEPDPKGEGRRKLGRARIWVPKWLSTFILNGCREEA